MHPISLLEGVFFTLRLQHHLENEIRANTFLYQPDNSTELLGV